MEIKYDREADAVYIEFKKGTFSKNKKINDYTIIDLDEKGDVLGIEFLDASKNLPKDSFSKINSKDVQLI